MNKTSVPDFSDIPVMTDEEKWASIRDMKKRWDASHSMRVFCYGSLLWKKEEDMVYYGRSSIDGYSRNLCVWSVVHRGSAKLPGLVLGLIDGGECEGCLMDIDGDVQNTLKALWDREMPTNLYQPLIVDAKTDSGTVKALTFIVSPSHRQFAGHLPFEEKIDIIRRAKGISGHNTEYVTNTLKIFKSLNIRDPELEALGKHLTQYSETDNRRS